MVFTIILIFVLITLILYCTTNGSTTSMTALFLLSNHYFSPGKRPFGVSILYMGWDKHYGYQLYQSDPSGNYGGWKATCIGNNSAVSCCFLIYSKYHICLQKELFILFFNTILPSHVTLFPVIHNLFTIYGCLTVKINTYQKQYLRRRPIKF